MKRSLYFGTLIAILTMAATGFQTIGDPDFLKNLVQRLSAYNARYPEEKVYVQFDKPFYKPGDDIWFNVFAINSNTNKPTTISDVIYVELIDPKGNVTARQELALLEGTSHGDFSLAPETPGGLYTVRAFTQWMKNFGERNLFTKTIQVQRIITPRLLLKLDFEKESYGPGDVVKAKLDVTNLKNEKVSAAHVIGTVKVDGKAIKETSVYTDAKGVANISFTLPEPLTTTDGLLELIISTDAARESISRSIPIVLNKISLMFFPEGGQYVKQVSSRIAFKALNEFGKGADISGVIIDNNGNEVTTMESFHMGMGAVTFTPEKGHSYFARIQSPSGNDSLFALPTPQESAFTLQADNKQQKDSLSWVVNSPVTGNCYLVGRTDGELYYQQKITVKKGTNLISLPTKYFPVGIAVFTLFDEEGKEQCERLIFLNSEQTLNITLTPDKKSYLPREKVRLKVKTTDPKGNPVRAKLSLAVVDDQLIAFADDKQDNILSSLLLSSEVTGEIQEPSFYFDPNEPKAKEALDYLLLTQGWRRFSWRDVNEAKRFIVYRREKVNVVGGRLVNERGTGIVGDVTLVELSNKRRMESVTTTKAGHFVFKNIDPTVPLMLLTKTPGKIILQQEKDFTISLNDKDGTLIQPAIQPGEILANALTPVNPTQIDDEAGIDLQLDQDAQQLSEVVVVGFGSVERKEITGSVTTIYESGDPISANASLENALQGRVAGVMITQESASPGASQRITLRGSSSLGMGKNEPLYIIDGNPLSPNLNQNFSNGSMFGPEDIESITVMASPEASAMFGSAAANGVILITTKSRIGYTHFPTRQRKLKYSSVNVTPRKFSATREFYTPPAPKGRDAKRDDFRTTAYWSHTVVTGDNGEATVTFNNTDATSAFRITAEGITGSGLIGRKEEVYATTLPFSLDAKLPEFMGFEDVMKLPVMVKNETSDIMTGRIDVKLPAGLKLKESPSTNIRVAPNTAETIWFTISSTGLQGDFPIAITLASSDYNDEIQHTLHVQPVGFPVRLSFSANQHEKSIRFPINDAEKGTVKATLNAFPDVLSDLLSGAEAIFSEPHGCFEQTSSSTFPNVLALQFLRQTSHENKAVEEKALRYIKTGYGRLISYEVKGGGFEWFGKPDAHEALTAYGLLEFYEMKKVYPDVDSKMIERTRQWLLSRRNGDGTFKLASHGFDDFARPAGDISNAYITYALSEIGTSDLEKEYKYNLAAALRTKDMYQLALMANVAFNLNKEKDYNTLLNYISGSVGEGPIEKITASHSIVRSEGISLSLETTAFWALAMMKSPHPDLQRVKRCIDHIAANRSFGMFGSTQSTVMSLKALSTYASLVNSARGNGDIDVFVNNKHADHAAFTKDMRNTLVMNTWSNDLTSGEQSLRILFTGDPLTYAVDIEWYTKKPRSNAGCQVGLTTSLQKREMRVNETVRLTATLTNKTDKGLPMTMMVLGIPAGLNAQPWQLKELQEKKVFDFYEITGGKLVIYYRQMKPSETRVVNLDLKAEIPGKYTGSASSAYLYYTNEYRDWVKGEDVVIRE